jgi:hypothetical protein
MGPLPDLLLVPYYIMLLNPELLRWLSARFHQ